MSIKNSSLYISQPIVGIHTVCTGYSIVLYNLLEIHKDGYNDYMCGELIEKDNTLTLKNLRRCRVNYPARTSPFIWKNKVRYYLRDFHKLTPEMQENMETIIAE